MKIQNCCEDSPVIEDKSKTLYRQFLDLDYNKDQHLRVCMMENALTIMQTKDDKWFSG